MTELTAEKAEELNIIGKRIAMGHHDYDELKADIRRGLKDAWLDGWNASKAQLETLQAQNKALVEALELIAKNISVEVSGNGCIDAIELNITGKENPFGGKPFPSLDKFISNVLSTLPTQQLERYRAEREVLELARLVTEHCQNYGTAPLDELVASVNHLKALEAKQ